jgi:arylsulfatase A-like enzyme
MDPEYVPQPHTAASFAWALLTTLLLLCSSCGPSEPSPPPPDGPSVLLITIDTLRADRVGCYGYEAARTPILDSLAASGVVFDDAHAPTAITLPSHASILSGLNPFEHGAIWNGHQPIRDDILTIPDVLARAGYSTAAFISGHPLKNEFSGLGSRFDHYDENFEDHERDASATTDEVIDWLRNSDGRPFFAWVHYFDPHIPYQPPDRYVELFDPGYTGSLDGRYYRLPMEEKSRINQDPVEVRHMLARYDGEIAFVDDQIARLRDSLAGLGLLPNMLLIVTADHGETHGEHDSFFSRDLHKASLHVPLILVFPEEEVAPMRIAEQVRLLDIAPTIWDYLGLGPEPAVEGRSLLPLVRGQSSEPRPAYSLQLYPPGHPRVMHSTFALREDGYKLLWGSEQEDPSSPEVATWEKLYHVAEDPLETEDMLGDEPPPLEGLRQRLTRWRVQVPEDFLVLRPEDQEWLRSLGYIE